MQHSWSKLAPASTTIQKGANVKETVQIFKDEHLLAKPYHDKKDIYFLSTKHMLKEVPIGKSEEGRSVKMLQLVSN